ncbi:hypothetical protein GCK32_002743 [Trichostrongylus colubriformis]|uniref:Uncharacterized protein n=1 Tax=Trichostrongylus colubriformis TaxID=6319 RepID=A0AAN8IVV0_TRICO
MGICGSCLRLLLDAESDVKIHVIEPTSIGAEHSAAHGQAHVANQPDHSTPTLQVPEATRAKREAIP